jgi:hypothetical protein
MFSNLEVVLSFTDKGIFTPFLNLNLRQVLKFHKKAVSQTDQRFFKGVISCGSKKIAEVISFF